MIRNLVKDVYIAKEDLIYPIFIEEGENIKNEIPSMPGIFRYSIDRLSEELDELVKLGINSILLFGIPSLKDSIGSDALSEDGIIATSLRAIKAKFPNLLVITDLCFCEYTDHGHCGIIDHVHQTVDNDATLEISAQQALIHAKAGADMIAPSGMMDGIIEILRGALDRGGFENLPIMAYSSKFASGYYGPFRDVAESAPSFGDRSSYQMDPANRFEAINESLQDEAQGADILMIKPALAYLDLIRDLRERTLLPICAYNVSGEYSLLQAGKKAGVIDYERVMMETMIGIRRAGADMIITYHAKEIAEILNSRR